MTEEILLIDNKLISLENNHHLEMYSHIENLHFCTKSSFEISEKIKSLLITDNQISRDEILQITRDLIVKSYQVFMIFCLEVVRSIKKIDYLFNLFTT